MIVRANSGFGDYGVDASAVAVADAPIPPGTYQAAVDSLPLSASQPQSLTDLTAAALSANPVNPTPTTLINWTLIIAGGLFLVLFVPMLVSGRRH